MQNVNAMLRRSEAAGAIVEGEESGDSEWEGFQDPPVPELVDHKEEYIDEDRYTTVTVESVTVSRDGFHKPQLEDSDDENLENKPVEDDTGHGKDGKDGGTNKKHPPKKPKKKFRYESKIDRQLGERRHKAKKMARIKGQR